MLLTEPRKYYMPIDMYICQSCLLEFEFMKIRSDEVIECENCGETREKKLEKQFPNKMSFSLKGGGWFNSSYNKGKKK